MSDIPRPIIVDILSRLPVKSLCRFRCVSKPWLALINHPRFAKMHLSRTHKQRLLFLENNSLYSVQLETLSFLRNSIPVEIELPAGMELEYNDTFSHVIGSCNGLLCIRSVIASKGFLLYNPSTKECKTIPDVIQEDQDKLIGFGYAESINDYKIVKILLKKNEVLVYSLRKDSWISIPDLDFSFSVYSSSLASVNGAIHFVTSYHDRPTVIAAFDLVEDKLKTLPPPDFMLNKVDGEFIHRQTYLGRLSGCLCLSIMTDSESTELWVMKEYGTTESWTKILRTKSVHIHYLQPLCYLNNNETILVINCWTKNLIFWDSEHEKFKDVEIGCIQEDEWGVKKVYGVKNVYVESLVSPNRINGFTTEDDEGLLGYWFN